MGRDKARLPIAEVSLLEWQSQRLAGLGMPVWHSGPGGIVDAWPDFRGPLAGIASAISNRANVAHWLVVPVDMPALPLNRLGQLVEQGEALQVPVAFADSPLPLALPVTQQLATTLNEWLDEPEGPRSLRALMTHFNGHWLAETLTGQERLNLNTPEDWAQFQANSLEGETGE
jgi:molybdopterin-guanine dinucleotide biosynthesis protein A